MQQLAIDLDAFKQGLDSGHSNQYGADKPFLKSAIPFMVSCKNTAQMKATNTSNPESAAPLMDTPETSASDKVQASSRVVALETSA